MLKRLKNFLNPPYDPDRPAGDLQKHGIRVLTIMVAASLLLHLGSFVNLSYFAGKRRVALPQNNKIKIRVVQKKPDPEKKSQKDLVEVPQEKTEKPKDSKFKSFQDHKTEKETRIADRVPRTPGADAGQAGKRAAQKRKQQQKPAPQKTAEKPKTPKLKIQSDIGSLAVEKKKKEYRKLIPSSKELSSILNAGYQEYLDEEIAISDRIDINTSEYRYMGYFSSMRKSIELVWNYPVHAARRGMQGEVGLEFMIHKDGSTSRVRVIRSSGYKILDDAIVEAIQLASPFSPLPEGFGKERLLVTGSFRYILSSFLAGAH